MWSGHCSWDLPQPSSSEGRYPQQLTGILGLLAATSDKDLVHLLLGGGDLVGHLALGGFAVVDLDRD